MVRGRPAVRALGLLATACLAGCSPAPQGGAVADDELRGRIALADGARTARVSRVIDGDTVVLSALGSSRLIGVDTPEVHGGAECWGREASAFARRVLESGTTVRYVPGAERRDRYGRRLVYLWLEDGRSFNAMLAEGGYARALTIPPNDRYAERFESLARSARRRALGRWGDECRDRDPGAQRTGAAGRLLATHVPSEVLAKQPREAGEKTGPLEESPDTEGQGGR